MRRHRPQISLLLALLLGSAPAWLPLSAQAQTASSPDIDYDGSIHVRHVQGNIWLMAGEPGMSNVVVQVGNEGALVVDTGTQPMADKLLAQIRQLAELRGGDQTAIRFVIDTDGEADHIGGNQVIRQGGSSIVAGNVAFDNPGVESGAAVLANQNVLTQLVADSAAGHGLGQPFWPTDTNDFDLYNMHFNDEAVRLFHPHRAATDGNVIVEFRRSDVIAAGDTLSMLSYPLIDVAHGGSIDGELVALNKLIDMAVPADKQEGGTLVVPGHGRVCDQSDVVHYKNVITIIRNRVQYYKNQGKTLEQVLALKPSADYDQRWGTDHGPWTTRQFIEAVYKTLPAKGASFSMQTQTIVPAAGDGHPGEIY